MTISNTFPLKYWVCIRDLHGNEKYIHSHPSLQILFPSPSSFHYIPTITTRNKFHHHPSPIRWFPSQDHPSIFSVHLFNFAVCSNKTIVTHCIRKVNVSVHARTEGRQQSLGWDDCVSHQASFQQLKMTSLMTHYWQAHQGHRLQLGTGCSRCLHALTNMSVYLLIPLAKHQQSWYSAFRYQHNNMLVLFNTSFKQMQTTAALLAH